jgi:hypothetical protein
MVWPILTFLLKALLTAIFGSGALIFWIVLNIVAFIAFIALFVFMNREG